MGWACHDTVEQGGTKSERGGEILRIGQNRIFALSSGLLLAHRFTVPFVGGRTKPRAKRSTHLVVASKSHEVASVDGEPPISPTTLEKGIEQRNGQASLAAVNQQRPEAFDRHTLEALKQLYRELHRVCISAEDS
jgi:hypothetical protein